MFGDLNQRPEGAAEVRGEYWEMAGVIENSDFDSVLTSIAALNRSSPEFFRFSAPSYSSYSPGEILTTNEQLANWQPPLGAVDESGSHDVFLQLASLPDNSLFNNSQSILVNVNSLHNRPLEDVMQDSVLNQCLSQTNTCIFEPSRNIYQSYSIGLEGSSSFNTPHGTTFENLPQLKQQQQLYEDPSHNLEEFHQSISIELKPPNGQQTIVDSESQQPRDNLQTPEVRRKRPRKAINLEEKLRIIEYWEKNQTKSIQDISNYFGHPRTTIHGIIKNKKTFLDTITKPQTPLRSGICRIVEPPFRVLEELLTAWFWFLRDRNIPVSSKKITTQAFEVHRMLSALRLEPLPPCQFTTGWLKGFKNRRQIQFEAIRNSKDPPLVIESPLKAMLRSLDTYASDDIYTCDLVSVYLNPPTTSIPGDMFSTDSSSATVLLCCNASGSHKLEPLVLFRGSPVISEIEGDPAPGADADDLEPLTFENWLADFDMSLNRDVSLVVDETMWRLLKIGKRLSPLPLRFVKVIPVPNQLSALLPLTAKIASDFKAYYHTLLINSIGMARATNHRTNPNVYLGIISGAWNRIKSPMIQYCFQRFLVSVRPSSGIWARDFKPLSENDSSAQVGLQMALKWILPNIQESEIQNFLNQDRDIGPSQFLRSRIQAMQLHSDFSRCFNIISFGKVEFGSKKPKGRYPVRFKEVQETTLPNERSLAEQSNFSSYHPNMLLSRRPHFGSSEHGKDVLWHVHTR